MNKLTLTDIEGFFIKKVTRFGSGAKIDCPKQYLEKTVYVTVLKNEPTKRGDKPAAGKRKPETEKTKPAAEKKV